MPSVFVIDIAVTGTGVLVVVEVLSSGFGSGKPSGPVTVAVLERGERASAATAAVIVNVAVPPTGRLVSDALMLPEPLAGPAAPPAYDTVQVAPESPAGSVSATAAVGALLGPRLLTTSV